MIRLRKFAPNAGSAAVSPGAVKFGLGIAGIGFALALLPFVTALEEGAGLDWLFQNRGYRQPPPQVAVVSIDKHSAESLGLPAEPRLWPRSLHADLIRKLTAAGAAVVVFDIYFDKPRDPATDRLLGETIAEAGNVILFEYIEKSVLESADGTIMTEKLLRPIEPIGKGALLTASFPLPVVPVKVSRFWAFMTAAEDMATMPAAAFQAYMAAVRSEFNEVLREVKPELVEEIYARGVAGEEGFETRMVMSKLRLAFQNDPNLGPAMLELLAARPDRGVREDIAALVRLYTGPGSYYLNFYGPPRSIQTISFADVLAADADSLDFRDRAVFVGYSAEMQPDQKDSFYSVYSQDSGLNLSGVEIAATAFANLLEAFPVRPLAGWRKFGLVVLWGFGVGVLVFMFPPVAATLISGLLAVAYIWVSTWQFSANALWLPLVTPLMQLLIAWVSVLAWKLLLTRQGFGQFVPRQEVDRLSAGRDSKPGGDWVYRVLLSIDIASYTSSTERYTHAVDDDGAEERSEALWLLMNDYFTIINQTVEANDGLVCDQEGDSSIAVWGHNGEADAGAQALRAALDIQSAMESFHETAVKDFNRRMRSKFGVTDDLTLPTRIGVHAGWVRIGKIGGGHHYEFHVFGDPVNTVSRIQQYNKDVATSVLVSEDALTGVDSVVVQEIGQVTLRGKSQSVRLYELQALAL